MTIRDTAVRSGASSVARADDEEVLVVDGLTKHRGRGAAAVLALDGCSFTCRRGRALAVVGPNGSGKSTLLRLCVGLDHPDAGTVRLFGGPPGAARALARTGCLIDRPGVLPGLSGLANLHVAARRQGCEAQVAGLLERCGLRRSDSLRPVSTYSLGMRQRLGIAVALLGDPELLVLDEPTNGFDPAGIAWIRELIATHCRAGGAVMLASHLVAEVERVCDDVLVLIRGRRAAFGERAALLAGMEVPHLLETAAEPARVAELLTRLGLAAEVGASGTLRVVATAEDLARATIALGRGGIGTTSLTPEVSGLEVFLARQAGATGGGP